MAVAAVEALGARIRTGLLVSPAAVDAPTVFESVVAGHPVPDEGSERAGRRALQLAESIAPDETLLVLLSGGASALMAVAADGISLDDKRQTTDHLLRAGADIHSLNTVRKHLSAIKGGQLAARAAGRSLTLVVSDVVGDDVSVIASGPTVADASTFADARAVLDTFGGPSAYPAAVVARLERGARGELPETPKPGDSRLSLAGVRVIGSRMVVMHAAAEEAERRGYRAVRLDTPVVGEARDAAAAHVRLVTTYAHDRPRPFCIVSSGETTVHVRGRGKGGRNQEFGLAAAMTLSGAGAIHSFALASVGTDGVDGPTDAAGALVDSTTIDRARSAGLAPREFLSDNNTYAFFDAIGDLVRTGPTGTNVGDLQIILIA